MTINKKSISVEQLAIKYAVAFNLVTRLDFELYIDKKQTPYPKVYFNFNFDWRNKRSIWDLEYYYTTAWAYEDTNYELSFIFEGGYTPEKERLKQLNYNERN